MVLAPSCYVEGFVDHFATAEYHGLEGVRRSTALHRALFDDLRFEVVHQVAEDDRVASRWVLTGSNRGRDVRLWGITLSHLHRGRIVEDWSGFDSIELLRQLGVLRTLLGGAAGAWRAARRPPRLTAVAERRGRHRRFGPAAAARDATHAALSGSLRGRVLGQ
jgi:predicted ester cyclase